MRRDLFLASLLSFGLLLAWYHTALLHANHLLFATTGDGIRSYFVFLYHVIAGHDSVHFTGTNYPFGEFIVNAGSQPLLAMAAQWVSRNIIGLTPVLIGMFNGLVLLNPVFAAVLLYLILREYCAGWYAILGGAAISYLSPQLVRMLGHFGLAYGALIPLFFYLLLRFDRRPSVVNSVLYGLAAGISAGIHFYFLAMAGLVSTVYWTVIAGSALIGPSTASRSRETSPRSGRTGFRAPDIITILRLICAGLGHFFLQAILPVLILFGLVVLLDPELSYRAEPAGANFDTFRATLGSLFRPWAQPLGPGLIETISRLGTHAEGLAYVGTVPILMVAVILVRSFLIKTGQIDPDSLSGLHGNSRASSERLSFPAVLMVIGAVALAFAFGFPFRQFVQLQEWFPAIGQFRSVARFSWIFFYALGLFTFVRLFDYLQILRRSGLPWTGGSLVAMALFVQFGEGYLLAREINSTLQLQSAPCDGCLQPLEKVRFGGGSIDLDRFQAILPLPYFHIGSDRNFRYLGEERSLRSSMLLALRSRLPLLGVHSARASLRQTELNLSLMTRDREKLKEFREQFPNQKPILVVHTGERLLPEELRIRDRAQRLGPWGDLMLMEISMDELFEYDSPR